ncbi:MAG: lantibiotic immunity ABC transporter MutG family permease subunit [Lachnospiraceae bacterium]|nr:lantibiotic immunity ABC transporter MutG family permease subunit [Lachnospiraceae bacterium]
MHNLLRNLKSEYLKAKHTPLGPAHIFIPCAMAAVFLCYYAVTPWDSYTKVQAYFQMMGLGYPFLIGTFCAIVAEQEAYAGAFQVILSARDRKATFLSKVLFLFLTGAFSVMLASVLFGTGYCFVLRQRVVAWSFYWIAGLIMAGGSFFLYLWHMFLALRFNRGVTIGLGIAGSLLAAVLLTGLGDGIWFLIPAAWASRMVCSLMPAYSAEGIPVTDCGKAAWICTAATVAALMVYRIWSDCWDGRKGNE